MIVKRITPMICLPPSPYSRHVFQLSLEEKVISYPIWRVVLIVLTDYGKIY